MFPSAPPQSRFQRVGHKPYYPFDPKHVHKPAQCTPCPTFMNYRSLTVVVFSAKTMLHKPLFINIYDHCKCIFITQPLNSSITTVLPTLHFSPSVSFLSDPRLESLLPSLLLFKIIQKSQKITASSTLKWKIL